MAKAVWRRALGILEELHDLGADEVLLPAGRHAEARAAQRELSRYLR